MLSLSMERQLILRWQEHRDPVALSRLLESWKPMVSQMAQRSGRRNGLEEDLASEGVVAIMSVIDRYRPEGEIRFMSFAHRAVLSAMSKTRRAMSFPVSLPRPNSGDGTCAAGQAASRMITCEQVDDMEGRELACPVPGSEEAMGRRQSEAALGAALGRAMAMLGPLETALVERHLVDAAERPSLEDIARDWNVAPKHAKKLETRALLELRATLMSRGITPSQLHGALD